MWIRTSFLVFILSCTVSAKCATTSVGPGGSDAGFQPTTESTTEPTFAHCTSDAVKAAGNKLFPDVANAVMTDNYETALHDAAIATLGHFLLDEVKCGVELFIGSTQRKASADPYIADQVRRARAYLAAHP